MCKCAQGIISCSLYHFFIWKEKKPLRLGGCCAKDEKWTIENEK